MPGIFGDSKKMDLARSMHQRQKPFKSGKDVSLYNVAAWQQSYLGIQKTSQFDFSLSQASIRHHDLHALHHPVFHLKQWLGYVHLTQPHTEHQRDNVALYFLTEKCQGDLYDFAKDVQLQRATQTWRHTPWHQQSWVARAKNRLISAVTSLHQHNMAHCDIKPHNILIDRHGECKLADFGELLTENRYRRINDADALYDRWHPQKLQKRLKVSNPPLQKLLDRFYSDFESSGDFDIACNQLLDRLENGWGRHHRQFFFRTPPKVSTSDICVRLQACITVLEKQKPPRLSTPRTRAARIIRYQEVLKLCQQLLIIAQDGQKKARHANFSLSQLVGTKDYQSFKVDDAKMNHQLHFQSRLILAQYGDLQALLTTLHTIPHAPQQDTLSDAIMRYIDAPVQQGLEARPQTKTFEGRVPMPLAMMMRQYVALLLKKPLLPEEQQEQTLLAHQMATQFSEASRPFLTQLGKMKSMAKGHDDYERFLQSHGVGWTLEEMRDWYAQQYPGRLPNGGWVMSQPIFINGKVKLFSHDFLIDHRPRLRTKTTIDAKKSQEGYDALQKTMQPLLKAFVAKMQDTLDHFQEEDRPHMTAVLQDMAFILSVTKPSQTRSGLVKVQTSLRKKMRLPPCTLIESHFSARDDSVSGSPLGSPRSLRSESGQMSETTSLSSYGSTAPKSMDANQWIMTHWQPRLAHLQRGMAFAATGNMFCQIRVWPQAIFAPTHCDICCA